MPGRAEVQVSRKLVGCTVRQVDILKNRIMRPYPKTSGVPAKAAKRSLVPVFAEVWNSRPHVCRMCGARILEPRTWCFAHLIGKNLGKRHKYDPDMIVLVDSIACHERVDKELRPAAMASEYQKIVLGNRKRTPTPAT